jgi:hypothetical protein
MPDSRTRVAQYCPMRPPCHRGKQAQLTQPTAPDDLNAMVQSLAADYALAASWTEFVENFRGHQGDTHPQVRHIPHTAATLLEDLRRNGAGVQLSTPSWTMAQKEAALERGAHQSAKAHTTFLRGEFADMIRKKQWILLPSALVMTQEELRLSPLGVLPQRDRRPRSIIDYTFYRINEDTVVMAPPEAMQFGKALWRIIAGIVHANPRLGPVYLSKVDIADGFYRIWVKAADIPKLGVLLPTEQGQERLIGFPVVLPMGWKEPPPVFTSATETVTDLANDQIQQGIKQPPHRLDHNSESCSISATNPLENQQPMPRPEGTWAHGHAHKPVDKWDVYVDDFIGLAQGNATMRNRVKRALLHSLDRVFRGLDDTDGPHRQEPASVKKLLKGDATWATQKTFLGWVLDTVEKTIQLPPYRVVRLHVILAGIPSTQRRNSTKKWQQVIWELRLMVLAVPGAHCLFCSLQEALCHKANDGARVRLGRHVHSFLDDFRWLAEGLASRPTIMLEVVPSKSPATRGAYDASGKEMGGVHFVPGTDGTIKPYLWRSRFPSKITQQLVSTTNPTGKASNSDLELAGAVAQHDTLCQIVDLQDVTIHNCYDNTATVFWQRKGSATTTGPAAYLLRLQALHQRHYVYAPLHDYMPGEVNLVADVASRSGHVTDVQLLSLFESKFPQILPWTLCQLRKPMYSALTSALLTTKSKPESLFSAPKPNTSIGSVGTNFASKLASTPFSGPGTTPSPSCKFSVSAIAAAKLHPTTTPCALE